MHPLVSVVTPFHNSARYLAECIESVLAQTYGNFEYILVDNCSTDGGYEIAESYAKRDPRIRLIRRTALLPQVQNYNLALAEIAPPSKYCKMVQADDAIFPECLRLMVAAFEQSDRIGLVSAYDLKADVVRGSGFPLRKGPIPGREVVQFYFRTGVFVFGSPTTVMYRSSIVREPRPFYQEHLLHEDTEKCFEILQDWDFGFVYQVLSFLRVDQESISGSVRDFSPISLDRYITVQRYASEYLEAAEIEEFKRQERQRYYHELSIAALSFRGSAFWNYHRAGLATIGQGIDRPYLALRIVRELLGRISNPGNTVARVVGYMLRKA